MSNIDKILDRVRKMLSLAEHSDNEAEAALAAGRAAKLMEEHQLTEALVRLDDASVKPEAIIRNARLEPDAPQTGRKRVAWKEAISSAVAKDLGVHEFFNYSQHWTGNTMRNCADVRGFGRESAIQTWQYTCQYLWRTIDELADKAWAREGDDDSGMGTVRAWKNSFRAGCAAKIAERIYENRQAIRKQEKAEREALAHLWDTDTGPATPAREAVARESLALTVVLKDQAEVDAEYEQKRKGFRNGNAASIGAISGDGYGSGRAAGERVSLGGKRAALAEGQRHLKGGGK